MAEDCVILRALSGAWVEIEGTALRITARKKVAVLAFLALDRKTAPRELLSGLIWSDVTDAKARGSLRQALSDLRSTHPILRDALRIDRTNVSLDCSSIKLEIDLLIDEINAGHLPEALRGGGDILEDILYGFEAIGGRFSDWVYEIRKQCGHKLLDAVNAAASRTDLTASLRMDFAEVAMALDPLCENQCRFNMKLANELGDIGKALQIYSAFYARMEAELDMEPSLQTQDLAAEIKLGALSESQPVPPSPLEIKAQNTTTPKPPPARKRHHGRPVVAVLPLHVMGAEALDRNLSEMLVDDVVLKISQTRDISVISRIAIRHLSERPDVAQVLQKEHGARYIINGHIRRDGSTYHLNVELTKIDEGLVIWAESYRVNSQELSSALSRVASEVVNQILPNLHQAELSDAHFVDLDHLSAYQHVLRAQELVYTLSKPKFETAGELLQKTVETWPDFAPAKVAYADWHSLRVGQGWSKNPKDHLQALGALLEGALQVERQNGRALAMLGHNKAIFVRRYDEAMLLFDEALSITPGDAETLLWSGPGLAFAGHENQAIERLELARSLNHGNPLSFRYDHFLAVAYFAAENMEQAVRAGLSSLAQNGRYTSNLRVTAAACAALGKIDTAQELAARILVVEPKFSVSQCVASSPFRDPAKRGQYGDFLRAAGLPN